MTVSEYLYRYDYSSAYEYSYKYDNFAASFYYYYSATSEYFFVYDNFSASEYSYNITQQLSLSTPTSSTIHLPTSIPSGTTTPLNKDKW